MALEYKFENRGTVQVRPTGSDKRNPCWYMLIAALLLVLMMATWLFFSGYLTPVDSSGAHAVTLRGKMDEQERLLTKQLADIKALEDQLATVKREQQVQVSANDELTKKFAAASAELASEREKLVLEKMVEGLTKKEIANVLDMNFHTVDAALRSIYTKLEVNTRTGLFACGCQAG